VFIAPQSQSMQHAPADTDERDRDGVRTWLPS